MENRFFEKPILNSPYEYPRQHWELDGQGQPTQQIIPSRRRAEFITPIPKPKKRKGSAQQQDFVFDEGKGLSTQEQQYDPTPIINELRRFVDQWRDLPMEDAKEKKNTMDIYWILGVNNSGTFGRWAFAEFTKIYQIETDFAARVKSEFNKMIEGIAKSEA
jgi:hypothetical protein